MLINSHDNNNQFAVQVRDIHKSFKNNHVLKGISFDAIKGDTVSIIGASGSGKSTLLRCINHLVVPDTGEIQIGENILRSKLKHDGSYVSADQKLLDKVRTKLGMVFQNFNLWSHRTILQNITEGPIHVKKTPKTQAEELAHELLTKVGLSDKANAYPNELSGGQQQRVAIARALAMKPEVLLFDEPTSALDPEMVGEVLRVIRDLASEGRTMIIVTHEMKFARDVSNQTMFLHNGHILEQGNPLDIFDNPRSERLQQFLQPLC